eukprot:jgi/Mesen1/6816/ME000035S06204
MSKSYAIELYFDTALENQILKIWNVLARRQISSTLIDIGSRPHITLSVHEDLDPAKLRTAIENFAQQQQPTVVTLSAVGSFSAPEGVFFLAPTPTTQILTLHDHFQELLKRLSIQADAQYLPGSWFPHCIVAQDVPQDKSIETFSNLQGFKLPLSGHLCDIGLVESRPVKEQYSFPLGGDFL